LTRGRLHVALVSLATVALVAAGCGGDNDKNKKSQEGVPAQPSNAGAPPSANTGARLAVEAPTPSSTVSDTAVPTAVAIENFRVDCRFAGTSNRKGVGHYHMELDHKLVNMYCGPRASISMQNVKPGTHTLLFIPAENDHTDDLKAEKSVKFSYRPSSPLPPIRAEEKPGKPSIRIVSPKPGATVSGSFDLRVAPKNFEFSCALYGKDDIAGYGHWHANVDSTSKGMMGMGTMLGMSCARSFHVSLAGIKPGKHKFFAILEDNQHAPTPKAQDAVELTVR
jgi:hypothetical protein